MNEIWYKSISGKDHIIENDSLVLSFIKSEYGDHGTYAVLNDDHRLSVQYQRMMVLWYLTSASGFSMTMLVGPWKEESDTIQSEMLKMVKNVKSLFSDYG